ncbi:aminotransferase class III-fold pyridoxal phosphate-dependent enzyme [Streptomyces sp. NPDC051976]|uniref:aminotransferase class III-fold pyridoxal phosphate-dependent enzyme n=1 Tax=Streptomyces sp. NPDC051976 TaxID=3154947 RepID=UPI003416A0A1
MAAHVKPVLDPDIYRRLDAMRAREERAFASRTTKSAQWLEQARTRMPDGVPMSWMRGLYRHLPVVAVEGSGSSFRDLDGNSYVDFNLCDLSMAAGFAHPAIAAAVTEQAARGNQFLLPTADALDVCALLSERFPLPQWQFTLSASGANTDALRLARSVTERRAIVVFDGKYHGQLDQTLWSPDGGRLAREGLGLDPASGDSTTVLPYNDVDALRARLRTGDVAAVLLEPTLTNCGLVLPTPEFVAALNEDVRGNGALLVVDETHTQFAVHGGGTRRFGFRPDIITGGKGIAGGVAIGVFGMTDDLGAFLADHRADDPGTRTVGDSTGVATGGTLYGNALSMAAARAGLREVFTEEGAQRVDTLAGRLQALLQQHIDSAGQDWTIDRFGGRLQWRLTPDPPLTGADSWQSIDLPFVDTRRIHFANRGVWEAIATSGPSISFAATAEDVSRYAEVAAEFLGELFADPA